MTRRYFSLTLSLLPLAIGSLFGIAGAQFAPSNISNVPIAEINGENIMVEEIDQALGVRLTNLQEQMHVLKRGQLDSLIAQRLLAQEARRRGISIAALLDAEVTAKVSLVTETEIEAVYQASRPNFQGSENDQKEKVRSSLQQRKLVVQREKYVQSLREHSTVVDRLQAPPVMRVEVSTVGAPVRGQDSAPITVVEFSDFHCPFCKRVQPTLSQLLDHYPGKVKVVFRDFPLAQLHPQAARAAEAARCAQDQGKFWEYHDVLFEQAPKASDDDLKHYAKEVGLDAEQFAHCVSKSLHRDTVLRDVQEGTQLGISGTPAFFVNGRFVNGAQPFDKFAQIIDDELVRLAMSSAKH
jgi:protein-disulfide isomerase